MSGLLETVQPLLTGLACRVLRPGTAGDNFLFGTYDFRGNRLSNPKKDKEREAARDFLGCPEDLPDEPGYSPDGIQGTIGQCPVPYNFKGTYGIRSSNGNVTPVSFSQGGSISNKRYGPHRGFRVGLGSTNRPTLYQLAHDAGGNPVEYTVGSIPAGSGEIIDAVLTEANRFDDQPDDCGGAGDPRPRYDGDVTYDDPNGNPVTQPVTIVFNPPRANPDGGLSIPFDISLPDVSLGGEFDIGISPSLSLSPDAFGDRPIAPPDVAPDIPDDAPPEPPEEYQPIVGVVATTTIISPFSNATEYGDGQPPTIYYPGLSQIMFAFAVAGTRAWSKPYPVSLLQQYIAVEGEIEAYDVRVVNSVGFTTSVQPVRLDKVVESE